MIKQSEKGVKNIFLSIHSSINIPFILSSDLGDILDDDDDDLEDGLPQLSVATETYFTVEDLPDGPEYLMVASAVNASKSSHHAGRKLQPFKGNVGYFPTE